MNSYIEVKKAFPQVSLETLGFREYRLMSSDVVKIANPAQNPTGISQYLRV